MGTFSVEVEASGPDKRKHRVVDTLIDTGATYSALPASLLRELGVEPHTTRHFQLANGQRIEKEMGRAWIKVDGREEFTLVVFGEDDVRPLLGAVTLEELALGVDPVNKRLVPVDSLLMGYEPR